MIFIQACRGPNRDPGFKLTTDGLGDLGNEASISFAQMKIPTHADFLVYQSTFKGFKSLRNKTKGSWLIQALVSIFDEHHKVSSESKYDLLTLLTLVNQEVAFNWESRKKAKENATEEDKKLAEEINGKKSMPIFSSTLTKLVRFSRG